MGAKAIFAFLSIYLVWGSTYLAIRYAIDTIPPWTLSSLRFFLAGLIMYALSKWAREGAMTASEKRTAFISGALLVVANGLVCVVEAWVASGIVAVVIGAMPIWILMVGWIGFRHGRPAVQQILGAVIGLCGIALIAGADHAPVAADVNSDMRLGVLLLFMSGVLWASGTLMLRQTVGLKAVFRFSAWQMISGAAVTLVLALVLERPWDLDFALISARSWLSLGYLVIFGSVISFSAYLYLSRNFAPHIVSTYALVNPLIAVGLGWMFLGESVDIRFAFATLLVLVGLCFLILKKSAPKAS